MEWFDSFETGFLFNDNFGLEEIGLGNAFGIIEGTLRIIEPGFGSRFFFFCFSASSSKSLSQFTCKNKIVIIIPILKMENIFYIQFNMLYQFK